MRLVNILRTNWCATIGLNWKAGGWQCVMRMPIRVYGRLKWSVDGCIELRQPLERNMLTIGSLHEDYRASAGRAELRIEGCLRIDGRVCIGQDAFVGVAEGARLSIGDGTFIGRDSQIHCSEAINIGRDVFVGETYITDSTEHPIIKQGIEQPMHRSVRIGDGVYGGFRTMMLGGTVIPPRSVIASGAVCTKDYAEAFCQAHPGTAPQGVQKLLLAGMPACIKDVDVTALK